MGKTDEQDFYTLLFILIFVTVAFILFFDLCSKVLNPQINDTLIKTSMIGGGIYHQLNSTYTTNENPNEITGGNCSFRSITGNKPIEMQNYVIDGQNMMHTLFSTAGKKQMQPTDYKIQMDKISHILSNALKKKNIHIVTKNFERSIKKKGNIEDFPSIKSIISTSKKYKNIIYHVAFDYNEKKPTRKTPHWFYARDDILAMQILKELNDGDMFNPKNKPTCLITNDKLKDAGNFKKTKPFYYYSIKNGKVTSHGELKPIELNHYPPNNCFEFTFYEAKDENTKVHPSINGEIHKHNYGANCMYLRY